MWNVTDETPGNSECFLQHGGMNYFLRCKEQFPNSIDLLRYVCLVTDETPGNSECFLQHGGMNYFLRRKEQFPNSMDLLRYV
jgi:hypothetical protein